MKLLSRFFFGLFLLLFLMLSTFLVYLTHLRNEDMKLRQEPPLVHPSTSTSPQAMQIIHQRQVSSDAEGTRGMLDQLDIEKDLLERRRTKDNVCSKYGLDQRGTDQLHQVYPWEYLISKEHSLVWCNVFKSASSSWMYVFNQLAGHSTKFLNKKKQRPPMTIARDFYPRPSKEELIEAMNNSLSFITARHPLERLVSGFRDKILGAIKGTHHDKMGKAINRKYGRSHTKKPSFSDFVTFVLATFKETGVIDMHWSPAFSFCNVCQMNFTMIIKFETFERDQAYLLQKAGLQGAVQTLKMNAAQDGQNSQTVMNKYVEQLPLELLEEICDFYKYDFQIFGYSYPKCDFFR